MFARCTLMVGRRRVTAGGPDEAIGGLSKRARACALFGGHALGAPDAAGEVSSAI